VSLTGLVRNRRPRLQAAQASATSDSAVTITTGYRRWRVPLTGGHLKAVHSRHHHIEQDDVGQLGFGHHQRGGALSAQSTSKYSLSAWREQSDVELDIVDDQNAGGHASGPSSGRKRSMVRMKPATEIGFAI